MTGPELRALAPRLCRAYDQLLEQLDVAGHQHRVASDELLSAERCLAHRELQLVRSGRSRDGRYKLERHEKLHEIRERRDQAAANAKARHEAHEQARAAIRRVDEPHRHHQVRELAA